MIDVATPTPVLSPLETFRQEKVLPFTETIYNKLPYVGIFVAFIVLVFLMRKIYAAFIYRKYKGIGKDTNKWFDWDDYQAYFSDYIERKRVAENEKVKNRLLRREQNRHPKKEIQNNS